MDTDPISLKIKPIHGQIFRSILQRHNYPNLKRGKTVSNEIEGGKTLKPITVIIRFTNPCMFHLGLCQRITRQLRENVTIPRCSKQETLRK